MPAPSIRQPIILKPGETAPEPTDLPPAGHERDELLRKREDALDEEIDRIMLGESGVAPETHRISPEALKPDRELRHEISEIGMLTVSKPQPGYVYSWTYIGPNNTGQFIWQKKAHGWEVVGSGHPEAREHIREDGTRRCGDVILMRTTLENKRRLDEREARRNAARELGVASEVEDIAASHPDALVVHGGEDRLRSGQTMMSVMEKRAAQNLGMRYIDKSLRAGTVPGMPAPGINP